VRVISHIGGGRPNPWIINLATQREFKGDREMQASELKIDTGGDVISLVTTSGTILHTSPSTGSVFGYRPEEIVGSNAFDLIHPEDRDHLRRAASVVLARPCTRRLRMRALRKNGEWRWVESTIYKLPDEYGTATILVNCREMVGGANAGGRGDRETDELLSSNARLEHFAYAVAHDLREPLRTISIFTELLITDTKLDAQGESLAQFISGGVTRMATLLEGLHSFAIDALDRSSQTLDLALVADEVLQDLRHAIATSKAKVTVDPLPFVKGNKVHLVRVFQNLIVNAIKYRSEAPVEIHITAEQLGPKWIVRVKDNGIGIASEQQEQIFDLFKRLHGPEIPGSGIGLAICRKIVEAMGDAIWVESAPGFGSIFCFTVSVTAQGANGEGQFESNPAVVTCEVRAPAQA
jgi:PAS domain S-box-containing protein